MALSTREAPRHRESVDRTRETDSLRVLMVCPQYRPLIGGYERAAERLATVLARRGHEVQVVTERRDPGWPAVEDVDGVRIERFWCLPRPGLHMPTALLSVALFLLRRGRRFDIIHVGTISFRSFQKIRLAWSRVGAPKK